MGTSTSTPQTTPARSSVARTPRALQSRRLTLGKAIDQWAETQLAIEGLTELRAQAAEVLLDHARRTGRRTFKDRIAVIDSGGSLVLDQPKVKAYLGERLREFQTRTKRGLTLKLLK